MIDIQCTRCGASGKGYPNIFNAKFTLIHEIGCGAKVGIPKITYSTTATDNAKKNTIKNETENTTDHDIDEILKNDIESPIKKNKVKKRIPKK